MGRGGQDPAMAGFLGFSRSHLQRRSRVRICVRAQVRPRFRRAGTMPVRIRERSAPVARVSAVGGGWASSRMEWAIGSAVEGDGLRCWAERRNRRGCAGPSHLCFGRSGQRRRFHQSSGSHQASPSSLGRQSRLGRASGSTAVLGPKLPRSLVMTFRRFAVSRPIGRERAFIGVPAVMGTAPSGWTGNSRLGDLRIGWAAIAEGSRVARCNFCLDNTQDIQAKILRETILSLASALLNDR